jgi:hypothetical protein
MWDSFGIVYLSAWFSNAKPFSAIFDVNLGLTHHDAFAKCKHRPSEISPSQREFANSGYQVFGKPHFVEK